jgi:hypothetical protein
MPATILCYVDLIRLGVVGLGAGFLGLGPRPIAFIAQGGGHGLSNSGLMIRFMMRSGKRGTANGADDHHRSDRTSFFDKEHREQSNSVDD